MLIWVDPLGASAHSVGTGAEAVLVYDYFGSWSEAPPEAQVPLSEAVHAASQFAAQGTPVTERVLFIPEEAPNGRPQDPVKCASFAASVRMVADKPGLDVGSAIQQVKNPARSRDRVEGVKATPWTITLHRERRVAPSSGVELNLDPLQGDPEDMVIVGRVRPDQTTHRRIRVARSHRVKDVID